MILKKLNQYMGIVAILLTVYCLWNVSDTRYRLEVVTHNLEDLQRKVHIMHGADLLEAKERRDRREANMMEPPKWSGSKEKILHVEDFYSSKNSKSFTSIQLDNKSDLLSNVNNTMKYHKANLTHVSLNLLDPNSYLSLLDGENVISMSLWGTDRRYTNGVLRNADLIKVTIEYIDSSTTRVPPMMWRFLVADDLSVDRFLVRDADSRLSGRDAAAVAEWEQSGLPLQCARDHPSHSGYALSGGLFGGKPTLLQNVMRRRWEDLMYGYRNEYLQDMAFLNDIIWPKFKTKYVYCSDSFSCKKWPGSHPFPVRRLGYEHVGQVYGPNEMFRPEDVAILRRAGENSECTPP